MPIVCSMMTASQLSGHSGSSCGNSANYSPWGPPMQQCNHQENLYNNPVSYPSSTGRHQITPPPQSHQLPPPLPPCCPPNRHIHPHYPPSHSHSDNYQPYNYQNRRCPNTRPQCGSYDALTSPQTPQLPNPEWFQPPPHLTNFQQSQNQIYTCTSDCSDHSLKHHLQHPQHHTHATSHQHSNARSSLDRNEILNDHAIYENDETDMESSVRLVNGYHNSHDNDGHSDGCCSSKGEDTCCSCSESSCLYAEAGDPTTTATATHNNVQIGKMISTN